MNTVVTAYYANKKTAKFKKNNVCICKQKAGQEENNQVKSSSKQRTESKECHEIDNNC